MWLFNFKNYYRSHFGSRVSGQPHDNNRGPTTESKNDSRGTWVSMFHEGGGQGALHLHGRMLSRDPVFTRSLSQPCEEMEKDLLLPRGNAWSIGRSRHELRRQEKETKEVGKEGWRKGQSRKQDGTRTSLVSGFCFAPPARSHWNRNCD